MVQLLHGILFFSQPPFGLTLSVTLLGEELFFGSRTSTTSFYWPWRDGRGGNVRSDGLLSDFLSHFCPRQPLCRVMSKLMNVLFLLLQLLLFLPLFDLRESTPRERESLIITSVSPSLYLGPHRHVVRGRGFFSVLQKEKRPN